MDYRYLRAFQMAARTLNFGQAARELRIGASALSRQIALLEASLGQDLFLRSTRKVALTPQGEKLYASLRQFNETLGELQGEAPLRIGCLQSVFEHFLVDLMARQPAAFAGPLDIIIGTQSALQERFANGEFDLMINTQKPASSAAGFRLFAEAVKWEGTGERPIVFSASARLYPRQALEARNRIRVNSFNAAMAMAQRGVGRALVAMPASCRNPRQGLDRQWIYASMAAHRHVPARLPALMALLRKEAAKAG
jgi:DNA-binding transcriptional LysR family regulator